MDKKENAIKIEDDLKQEESPKFIAIIVEKDGIIKFKLEGLSMDEALIAMKKGGVQFEKLYNQWVISQ